MPVEAPFFRDIALVFVAAVAGGALAKWARQPLFIGYIIGGLLISPFTPGPAVQDVHTFEIFAQIGVVLLMFSIGVEFSLAEISRLGAPALLGAPAAMALIVFIATGVGVLLGWPIGQAAAVGAAISVASTMVVAKLLAERGELHTPHAHLAIATLLMEDLIVVALIVLLPVLAGETAERGRAVALGLVRAAIVLLPFFYLANRVVPQVMARVARRGNPEMFILVAMAIGVGTAALSSGLGLSLALGAFLGGLIISESEFTHEVLARILPMRDLFGALFFVSVGTLIRPTDLASGGFMFLVVALLTSEPVLKTAGAGTARLAVLAIPDFERTRLAVRRLREINAGLPILARSTHPLQRTALIDAGATEVIQPEFEAAQTLLRHGLEQLGVPHEQIKTYMLKQEHVLARAELPEETNPLELLQTWAVTIGAGYAEKTLEDAEIREHTGVSVLAVRRADGTELLNPDPGTLLRAGDRVTVIGMPDQIALFMRTNAGPIDPKRMDAEEPPSA